jgi:hypothetical protein
MMTTRTPEERAQSLVHAGPHVPGGPWFVELRELVPEPVLLGPYENLDLAKRDARKLQQYLAAVLRSVSAP